MHYPVHKSDTGSFQELARASDVRFGQLSVLTINPRCERGGHYHTRKTEWFCCIQGECTLKLSSVIHLDGKTKRKLSGNRMEFVEVPPFKSHRVTNQSSGLGGLPCIVLIICDEEYDPSDPDTFPTGSIAQ